MIRAAIPSPKAIPPPNEPPSNPCLGFGVGWGEAVVFVCVVWTSVVIGGCVLPVPVLPVVDSANVW